MTSSQTLTKSFERPRIGQLYVWLDELASLLPDHAAGAVAQSLDWWQRAVNAAATGSKLDTKSELASYLTIFGRELVDVCVKFHAARGRRAWLA